MILKNLNNKRKYMRFKKVFSNYYSRLDKLIKTYLCVFYFKQKMLCKSILSGCNCFKFKSRPENCIENCKESNKFEYFDGIRGSLALSVLIRHGTYYYGISNDYPFFWKLGKSKYLFNFIQILHSRIYSTKSQFEY